MLFIKLQSGIYIILDHKKNKNRPHDGTTRNNIFAQWDGVTHFFVSWLSHHWFWYLLIARSALSHYLCQRRLFAKLKMNFELLSVKWRLCWLGLNVSNHTANIVLWHIFIRVNRSRNFELLFLGIHYFNINCIQLRSGRVVTAKRYHCG